MSDTNGSPAAATAKKSKSVGDVHSEETELPIADAMNESPEAGEESVEENLNASTASNSENQPKTVRVRIV